MSCRGYSLLLSEAIILHSYKTDPNLYAQSLA